eukprot:CAMPEP_0197037410 /NCGR_PEP_ID=MMETSP1384-20130603/14636_1 /TAXON_ID=29189 /ORGANISM="Ammonia sp." /LENGTH=106 /DNA_ID=CAMNT_0042467713 /DNA_START=68 /DNA_END=385 /DNA_ORIENTATION=+
MSFFISAMLWILLEHIALHCMASTSNHRSSLLAQNSTQYPSNSSIESFVSIAGDLALKPTTEASFPFTIAINNNTSGTTTASDIDASLQAISVFTDSANNRHENLT